MTNVVGLVWLLFVLLLSLNRVSTIYSKYVCICISWIQHFFSIFLSLISSYFCFNINFITVTTRGVFPYTSVERRTPLPNYTTEGNCYRIQKSSIRNFPEDKYGACFLIAPCSCFFLYFLVLLVYF